MEEEKMVEVVEKATENIAPSITAKKMNGLIVAAAAGVGVTIGGLAMWLVPKAVKGIVGLFKKKGKKEEDITAELDTDDGEEFFDEP